MLLLRGPTRRFLEGCVSSTHTLDLVAQFLQLGGDALPLVALNLDAPVLDRAPGAAPLLEQGGEFPHAFLIEWQVEHGRHALATPARGSLPTFKVTGFLAGSFTGGAGGAASVG